MFQPSVEETEPGVYVRSNRPENDLDFLWDRERRKHIEHDKFHLGFFLAGALVGALLTLGVIFLITGGNVFNHTQQLAKPVVEEETIPVATVTTPEKPQAKPEEAAKPKGLAIPFLGKPTTAAETAKPAAATAQSYEVQSGDTLGGIAGKFYQDSGPEMVEKIQRANNLGSADSLQIGQKLTIPPKSY